MPADFQSPLVPQSKGKNESFGLTEGKRRIFLMDRAVNQRYNIVGGNGAALTKDMDNSGEQEPPSRSEADFTLRAAGL
jgi:hypothetical protein